MVDLSSQQICHAICGKRSLSGPGQFTWFGAQLAENGAAPTEFRCLKDYKAGAKESFSFSLNSFCLIIQMKSRLDFAWTLNSDLLFEEFLRKQHCHPLACLARLNCSRIRIYIICLHLFFKKAIILPFSLLVTEELHGPAALIRSNKTSLHQIKRHFYAGSAIPSGLF